MDNSNAVKEGIANDRDRLLLLFASSALPESPLIVFI
jgi:hypothetical protein